MNKPLFPLMTRTLGPPWEIALQNLDTLEKQRLWQAGKIKEYYSELTDILRHYLQQQHAVEAMEMITDEILSAYDSTGLDAESRPKLFYILTQADYAKFAKAVPQKAENELSMTYARQFIEATKPIVVPTNSKSAESTALPPNDTEVKA